MADMNSGVGLLEMKEDTMSIDATCPFCRYPRLEINQTDVPRYKDRMWLNCEHCQAEFPMVRSISDAYKLIESITVGCDRKAVVVDYMGDER